MAKAAYIGVPTVIPRSSLLGDIIVGDTVKLNVDGVVTDFLVVNQGNPNPSFYDSSCDGTWLLMKDVYAKGVWNSSACDYASSNIHNYLNSTFLNSLDDNIQSVIKQVKIPYRKGASGTTIANLSAKLFLLSVCEVGWTTSQNGYFYEDGACLSYFKDLAYNDTKRTAYYNGSTQSWWLRTQHKNNNTAVYYVDGAGRNGNTSVNYTYGVRPALILPSTLGVETDGTVSSTPASDEDTIINVARKIKYIYIGVNGVARKVKKGLIGAGGLARKFFGDDFEILSYYTTQDTTSVSFSSTITNTTASMSITKTKSVMNGGIWGYLYIPVNAGDSITVNFTITRNPTGYYVNWFAGTTDDNFGEPSEHFLITTTTSATHEVTKTVPEGHDRFAICTTVATEAPIGTYSAKINSVVLNGKQVFPK